VCQYLEALQVLSCVQRPQRHLHTVKSYFNDVPHQREHLNPHYKYNNRLQNDQPLLRKLPHSEMQKQVVWWTGTRSTNVKCFESVNLM
jgi:hypothetical protein